MTIIDVVKRIAMISAPIGLIAFSLSHGAARGTLVMVPLGGICPMALVLLGLRINEMSFSDNGFLVVSMILMCVGSVAAGIWEVRRQARDVVLPRKRRLEALLKELDAP